MFDRASRPTITESVVESADSAVEAADYWSRPTGNWPSGYGPLEQYFGVKMPKTSKVVIFSFTVIYQYLMICYHLITVNLKALNT